jgi:hypothetical protein
MIKSNCKNCNKEFFSYISGNRKFCSLKCRNKSYIGKKASVNTINKMKIKRIGRKPSLGKKWKLKEETKKRISISQKGNKAYWWGKKKPHKEETKRKIGLANSISNKGKKQSPETIAKRIKRGEKHYNWQGGISFDPYSVNWTETLKRAIRERDKYICQLCNNYGNTVHHIDYNKKNCNPSNLINLCNRCNSKVNHNRNVWIRIFNKIIFYKYG